MNCSHRKDKLSFHWQINQNHNFYWKSMRKINFKKIDFAHLFACSHLIQWLYNNTSFKKNQKKLRLKHRFFGSSVLKLYFSNIMGINYLIQSKRKTRVFPLFMGLYELFTTAHFILLATSTWTLYSHIICIIYIYNITCISDFSRLGNIYIICIIRTIYIINISLLWTNCGHRPHPFTANIIPYFKVQ